jgi:hypothetical protein
MRIVVADQDDSFLGKFQLYLRARGHEVAMTDDGVACLNALRKFVPDVLAISSNLLWGGSEGVLSVMYEDGNLHDMPVLLLQDLGGGHRLRRHPMVVSAARRPYRFDDLASQCEFLSILGKEGRSPREPISIVDSALWSA